MSQQASRYNYGKTRYGLLSDIALDAIAEVYTRGAHKYSIYTRPDGTEVKGSDTLAEAAGLKVKEDGAHNWRKGMSWMSLLESTQRHIQAFKKGEDFDPEIKTYHLANAAWGLMTILDYYKTHPEYDDRHHDYLKVPRIGLDIDNVIVDWSGPWERKFGYPTSCHWDFSYNNLEHWKSFSKEELEDFYLNLPPLISKLPFDPICYITSRSVDVEITKRWLQNHGFPTVPVYSFGLGQSKVEAAKNAGIDIFIDDCFKTFVELNRAGICTYLFDAPHNRHFNVGYKRITNLSEILIAPKFIQL